MIEVVRNLRSNETHLANVTNTSARVLSGAPYRQPPSDTRACCGVHIGDGVVMQRGTRVKCSACRYINLSFTGEKEEK